MASSDLQSSMNNRDSPARRILNPHEEALQALCKKILKSRLFRGYFMERRYVDIVKGYRDVVALQRSERELEKLLIDICQKFHIFYKNSKLPMWFGITAGKIPDVILPTDAIDTYIWTEFNELAFGQYWFNIRSLRFRENEIILKIKMVRPFENATHTTTLGTRRISCSSEVNSDARDATPRARSTEKETEKEPNESIEEATPANVQLQDFIDIFQHWGTSIKHSTYHFLSQDVNKENIKEFLRFAGLMLLSLVSFSVYSLKFLGTFTLRLMFEISRFTHVLTPILLKIIDLLNKMIGGFYLLVAMLFRDLLINRGKPQIVQNELPYNRPMYRSIEYNVRQQRQHEKIARTSQFTDFEKKSQ